MLILRIVPRSVSIVLLALLAVALGATVPAGAQAGGTAVVTKYEWSEGGAKLRIEIEGEPETELILLRAPHRIVLDLADTVTAVRPAAPEGEGVVSNVRDGLTAQDRYRLLFELRGPVVPVYSQETDEAGTVLQLVFEPASEAAFAAAAASRTGIATREASNAPARADTSYTVVIDPGHGGADYGAVGEGGTYEKELNLSFARILREALVEQDEALEVVLTREDDTLVPLAERSAIARRAGADLFVSVHADSIRHRELRGATVYTLSLNASDQLSRELADSENAADRFAGPEWTQDTPEIHDILVDLVKRETEHLSRRFADELVVQLRSNDIRLINNPIRSAGFRVLMAPDVPSVLLEMGYLSNPDDETLMAKPEWQHETAGIVSAAIRAFLQGR